MREMKDSGIEWIGKIPENWQIMPIKYCKANTKNSFVDGPFGSNLKSDHYVNDGDVYVVESGFISTGKFIYKDFKTITKEHFETINRSECCEGDIIIAKIGANYGMAGELPRLDKPSVVSGNSLKLTLNQDTMLNYLFIRQLELAKTNGGFIIIVNETAQPALSLNSLNNFRLVVPPILEQKVICKFLFEKCTEIDNTISDIQSQIEILEQYKRSVITEAVTKGLDPNAEMKDSGIDYIGKMNSKWKLTKLRYICKKLNRYFNSDAEPLICSNKGEVFPRGDNSIGLVSDNDKMFQGVQKGDLLIHGMDTWHGAIAVSDYDGKCTTVVHVCDSEQNKFYICYHLQMLAIKSVYKAISNGVRENTSDFRSWEKAGHIYITLPPFDEQNRIARYIKEKIEHINSIIAEKQHQIETIEEYKKSLIFEYVTGKKEVEQ